MAAEVLVLDENGKASLGALTNNADLELRNLRVDPTTNRLLVDATTTITGQPTAISDGDAVNAANDGTMVLGTDGSNYQVLSVDTSGRMILGASSLAIGKLAANSGVDIGDVDVTSLPGVSATGSAVPASAFYLGITDGTNLRGAQSIGVAEGGAGTNILGAGIWLYDGGSAYYRLQGNNASGDAESASRVGLSANARLQMYNGASYDRVRGDTTNGLDVDVTRMAALVAGSAAIGKLAANSGVDIGDVDVTSIANGSLNGPGSPVIDSYTKAQISGVTGTNQALISAPGANKQIWVYGVQFTTTLAGTVAFQDEDDVAVTPAMNYAQYSGLAIPPSGNFAMPLWKVATNKALEVDVVTATINGVIEYAIVSV